MIGRRGQALAQAKDDETHKALRRCGIELLAQACAATDRVEALAAQINEDGEVIRTKGGLRVHPAIKDELALRSFIARTLQRLGLNLETVKPVGRPGGAGWRGRPEAHGH